MTKVTEQELVSCTRCVKVVGHHDEAIAHALARSDYIALITVEGVDFTVAECEDHVFALLG